MKIDQRSRKTELCFLEDKESGEIALVLDGSQDEPIRKVTDPRDLAKYRASQSG